MNVDMALTYLAFVGERHRIWERRQASQPAPWTEDPVLRAHKFTNVFRVLDYGSQFLLTDLLYIPGPATTRDVLMRCFLYRYTNRPEPWEAFREEYGRMPICEDLEENLPSLWHDYRAGGNPVFGNAYKMFSGAENKGTDRLTWITQLANRYFGFGPDDIAEDFLNADHPRERLEVLKTIPRCAGFMGMQILTDFGYWDPNYNENEFVVAGPGARVGARHIFPGTQGAEAIAWARGAVQMDPDLPRVAGRTPSMMDIQNTLCEFGKYVRYSQLPPKRKDYTAAHPEPVEPFLPPHWLDQQ
jgi:hypothetical protein